MLILQGVSYIHPDKDLLFKDIHLSLDRQDKAALVGHNGTGKSTLLRIMAGRLPASGGTVHTDTAPYYVPQLFDRFDGLSVAQALRVDDKLNALGEILGGHVTEENLARLADDWTIEDRCREAFAHWGLQDLDPYQKIGTLSGGQKTKAFLAGITVHGPDIVLLDEPSNHLDTDGRKLLYAYIESTAHTLVVVSHDRTLLNLVHTVHELAPGGITAYGGNYDFYASQKAVEEAALHQDLRNKEKALRKARETERETMERQQKLDARGKKKQEKAGLPTISMNTFRNNAEKSTARAKDVHAEKTEALAHELGRLRRDLPAADKMKVEFDHSAFHKGKTLINAEGINFAYGDRPLWKHPLDIRIKSGERWAVRGANGSGKTTFIRMVLGELLPQTGTLERAPAKAIYIDQDYSALDPALGVYAQAQQFNSGALQEHEIKTRLNRFLFTRADWDKPCRALSGGERMRLLLCCLTIRDKAPDIMVLDEPTNNLDIRSIEILTASVNAYKGTLLVVSHDAYFLEQVGIGHSVTMA